MDPNEALANIRRYVDEARWPDTSTQDRLETLRLLADQAKTLNEWLTGGGVMPAAWRRHRQPAAPRDVLDMS